MSSVFLLLLDEQIESLIQPGVHCWIAIIITVLQALDMALFEANKHS
jgi:uncharacterized MnhB-related membrane protein